MRLYLEAATARTVSSASSVAAFAIPEASASGIFTSLSKAVARMLGFPPRRSVTRLRSWRSP